VLSSKCVVTAGTAPAPSPLVLLAICLPSKGKASPSNSDIYALGIIGIQALTKMSPMQLQTLEDPLRELIWALGACQPGLRYCQRRCATTSKTATSQQRNAPTLQQVLSGYIPTSIREHNMVPLWNLCRHKHIWTNNVSTFRITQEPSRFKEWSGCGC